MKKKKPSKLIKNTTKPKKQYTVSYSKIVSVRKKIKANSFEEAFEKAMKAEGKDPNVEIKEDWIIVKRDSTKEVKDFSKEDTECACYACPHGGNHDWPIDEYDLLEEDETGGEGYYG